MHFNLIKITHGKKVYTKHTLYVENLIYKWWHDLESHKKKNNLTLLSPYKTLYV